MSNGVDYKHTFKMGDESELKVRRFLEENGFFTEKVDYKTHHYDLEATKDNKKTKIEVKSFGTGGYSTVPAEYRQYSTGLADYITHREKIDYFIWVNVETNKAYVFDNKIFAEYVLSNKSNAIENRHGTASVVRIFMKDKEAGFKYEIDFNGFV